MTVTYVCGAAIDFSRAFNDNCITFVFFYTGLFDGQYDCNTKQI